MRAIWAIWIYAALSFPCPLCLAAPISGGGPGCNGTLAGKLASLLRSNNSAGIDDIRKILSKGDIPSIDRFLDKLDPSWWENYVLMYRSGSLQKASEEVPRVILFNPEAEAFLAFAGSETISGGQFVEILKVDRQSGRLTPYTIESVPGKQGLQLVSEPKKCMGCHSASMHLNWDTYPLWPGAFGSSHFAGADLPVQQAERPLWTRFMASNAAGGRYRRLKGLNGFFEKAVDRNNAFSDAVARLNARRVANIIHSSPGYPVYREKMLAALRGDCYEKESAIANAATSKEELPRLRKRYQELEKDMMGAVNKYQTAKEARAKSLYPAISSIAFDRHQLPFIISVKLVAEQMGLEIEDWSFTPKSGTYSFTSPLEAWPTQWIGEALKALGP